MNDVNRTAGIPRGFLSNKSPIWLSTSRVLEALKQPGPSTRLACKDWDLVRPAIDRTLQDLDIPYVNEQARGQLRELTTGSNPLLRPLERGEIEGAFRGHFEARSKTFSKTFNFIYGAGKMFVPVGTILTSLAEGPQTENSGLLRRLRGPILEKAVGLHKLDERVFMGELTMQTCESKSESRYWTDVTAKFADEFFNGLHMEITRAILGQTVFRAIDGFALPRFVADSEHYDVNLLRHTYHFYQDGAPGFSVYPYDHVSQSLPVPGSDNFEGATD